MKGNMVSLILHFYLYELELLVRKGAEQIRALVNYGLWLPLFVNKVLLEHSMPSHQSGQAVAETIIYKV